MDNPIINYDPDKASRLQEKLDARKNAPYREYAVEENGQRGELTNEVTQEEIDKRAELAESRLDILQNAQPEEGYEQGRQAVNDRLMQLASGVIGLSTREVESPTYPGLQHQIVERTYVPFARPEVSDVERITAELERESKKGNERNPATIAALRDELRYAESLEHQRLQDLEYDRLSDSFDYEEARGTVEYDLEPSPLENEKETVYRVTDYGVEYEFDDYYEARDYCRENDVDEDTIEEVDV